MRIRRFVPILLAALLPAPALSQESCEELFAASHTAAKPGEILERVITDCPDHALALNNLAFLAEEQGRLNRAEWLYRRSIEAGGGAAPHAGLGDMLLARGEEQGAKRAYTQFLNLLDQEIAQGDPNRLAEYRSLYENKLQALTGDKIVSATIITRSLTQQMPGRGMEVVHHDAPHIDLPILFDHDSARLTAAAEAQIAEIATALRAPALAAAPILVEGHTDDRGTQDYNQTLSVNRARAVKHRLTTLGIGADRLIAEGRGETRPIAGNDTEAGRSKNRRVTFVNLAAE